VDLDIIKILNEFIKLASLLDLKEINLINLYKIIGKFDENNDGFLTDKEFRRILNQININNKSITDRILTRLFDKNNNNMIAITNFVLLIDYFFTIYKDRVYFDFGKEKYFNNYSNQHKFLDFPKEKEPENKNEKLEKKEELIVIRDYMENDKFEIKKNKIIKFLYKYPKIDSISYKSMCILNCMNEYEKITHKGFYSGAIIISKYFENNFIHFKMKNIQRKLMNFINTFNKSSIFKITGNFHKRICGSEILQNNNDISLKKIVINKNLVTGENNESKSEEAQMSSTKNKLNKKISDLVIPEVKISVFDENEMIEIRNINRSKILKIYYIA